MEPTADLQTLFEGLAGPVRVQLAPGEYRLRAEPYLDPTCGNCEDPATPVDGSRGLRISGTGIELWGEDPEKVVIHTDSGYGVLFEDCEGCTLRGVTVTGGRRDPDLRATNGAVVVRGSRVEIDDCVLRDNLGDPEVVRQVVVGIAGVVGREGSDIVLRDSRILHNSWDGVALYRDAAAHIHDNVFDGVEPAEHGQPGGGRGVGIGLTWNARAVVEGNLVTRYWKGIGVFVDARAVLRHNVVEKIRTWGIAVWSAGHGSPAARVEDNGVLDTGACGALIQRERACAEGEPCSFRRNALIRTGRNPEYDDPKLYCSQLALDLEVVPAGFDVEEILEMDNREAGAKPGRHDLERADFVHRSQALLAMLRTRPSLADSSFLRELR